MVDKKLPAVPESVLVRRKQVAAKRLAAAKAALVAKRQSKLKRKDIFRRAESYVKEYRDKERDEIRLKREARKNEGYHVSAEPRMAFVIRIKGINKVAPKVRKTLQLLRLRQINNGIFIKLNKATMAMLRICEPYIAWGTPSLKTIRALVYKRGFVKVDQRRTAITSNELIEQRLGAKHNVICVEDMVHELATAGPAFKYVSNFLWPFKLNTPTGGWHKKTNHFVEGGDFGCREGKINALLEHMI